MRTALAIVCSFTLLAVTYLSLSLLVLRPPRADYQAWFLRAALFAAVGGLTLAALAGAVSGGRWRWGLVTGAVAIIWVGAEAVRATLTGPHFEGYALLLGGALVVQGALTLGVFLSPVPRPQLS